MMFVPARTTGSRGSTSRLKIVARLQPEATEGGPYLLLPLPDSGQGGGTTLTGLVEHTVDEVSFSCWALDITPPSLVVASSGRGVTHSPGDHCLTALFARGARG